MCEVLEYSSRFPKRSILSTFSDIILGLDFTCYLKRYGFPSFPTFFFSICYPPPPLCSNLRLKLKAKLTVTLLLFSNSFFLIPVFHFPWSEKGREARLSKQTSHTV